MLDVILLKFSYIFLVNFNPRGHPDVANKIKTEDEVLGDFLDTFE